MSSAVSSNHKGSAIILLDLIVEGNVGTAADRQEYWLVDISCESLNSFYSIILTSHVTLMFDRNVKVFSTND